MGREERGIQERAFVVGQLRGLAGTVEGHCLKSLERQRKSDSGGGRKKEKNKSKGLLLGF